MKVSFLIFITSAVIFSAAVFFKSNVVGSVSVMVFFLGVTRMAFEAWELFLTLPKIDMTAHDLQSLSNLDRKLEQDYMHIHNEIQFRTWLKNSGQFDVDTAEY